jgi:hypothetical protein
LIPAGRAARNFFALPGQVFSARVTNINGGVCDPMETFDDSDETLVGYLLNELPKEANEELEDEMDIDPGLSERAHTVEANLIDAYLLGGMSAAERARFEKGFFILPENREKVKDARLFHQALHEHRAEEVVEQPPVREPVRAGWFATLLRLPAPALAFTALALVAAVVGGLLLIGRYRSNQLASSDNNNRRNERRQVNSQVEENRNEGQGAPRDNGNAPANNGVTESGVPENPEVAGSHKNVPEHIVVSIKENNGRVNESTMGTPGKAVKPTLITIPAGAKSFTLKVTLEHDERIEETPVCSVDVSTAKAARIYPRADYQKVKPRPIGGKYQVSLNVPTALLKDGEIYYFRVSEIDSQTPFKVRFKN